MIEEIFEPTTQKVWRIDDIKNLYTEIHTIMLSNADDLYTGWTISIYFQGCDIEPKCKNCHNPELQPFLKEKSKIHMPYKKFWDELLLPYYEQAKSMLKSVTFLGGEPLAYPHRLGVIYLSKKVKQELGLETFLYTGRVEREVIQQNLLPFLTYIDRVKSGRYVESLKDGIFGSSNQKYGRTEELFPDIIKYRK